MALGEQIAHLVASVRFRPKPAVPLDNDITGRQSSQMFWLSVASLFSAPAPVGFYPWFSHDDVPTSVRSKGGHYSVLFRTVVGPNGVLQGCEIERSSPDNALDAFTCSLVVKRAKLKPARWVDGSPVVGVFRSTVVWQAREDSMKRPSDLVLSVDRLPKGVRSPAYISVKFAADDKGKPVACGAGDQADNLAMVELACGEFVKRFAAIPPKNASGTPVRSVQNGTVRVEKKAQ